MSDRPRSIPSYRLHRQSGQAVTTLTDGCGNRKDVLLGKHGTSASRREYARVIAEWEAAGRALPPSANTPDLTINELLVRFLRWAREHYRHADGTQTGEYDEQRYSLRPLKELYGLTAAAEFGPLALKAVRGKMLDADLCRGVVNQRIGRIKRVFKWAVAEELVPHGVYAALATVAGLARGRSSARETEPVKPVPSAFVDAVLPFVLEPVRAMIELQTLTGMRPGEVCRMRAIDIDMTGAVWLYRPARHKTEWRGKDRVIALGQRSQTILRPLLTLDTQAPLFSPARGVAAKRAALRAGRKSPVQPSQVDRRSPRAKRRPGAVYNSRSYAHAIRRGCRRAGVPHWHPNQLRHNFGTEVRRRDGLDAAQVMLGHSRADVTQIYAEKDLSLAVRIAAEVG
jgi:integrase